MVAATQAGVSVPVYQPDETRHRRQIADWAQWANQGHLANVGNVTLTPNAVSTGVVDARVSINSFIGFMPTTANALSAGGTLFVSTITTGGFTITHNNSASVDKTFRYALLG